MSSEPQVSRHMQMLIEEAWKRSTVIHQFLQNNPVNPMAQWPSKLMFLGLLAYSSSMAKLVDMDRTDFLALCAGFYDNILVTLGQEQPPSKS